MRNHTHESITSLFCIRHTASPPPSLTAAGSFSCALSCVMAHRTAAAPLLRAPRSITSIEFLGHASARVVAAPGNTPIVHNHEPAHCRVDAVEEPRQLVRLPPHDARAKQRKPPQLIMAGTQQRNNTSCTSLADTTIKSPGSTASPGGRCHHFLSAPPQ
jgi:hypothetical protein